MHCFSRGTMMLLRRPCHEDDHRVVCDVPLKCSLIGENITSVMNVLRCKQRRGDNSSTIDSKFIDYC